MSVLLEQLAKEGEVPLERYGHQVGGRQLLFKYKDTLCKPLIPREHFFYETAPEAIQRYIPRYFGVVSVSYVKQPSGEIQVIASLKDHQQRVSISPSIQRDRLFPKCTNSTTVHSKGVSIITKMVNGDEYFTPWATMCSENMDRGLNEMAGGLQDFNKDYVILENLTTKFQAPSVLDLKVGTNWPGDNPSPIKETIPDQPVFRVRMAGMQKFDSLRNQYTFYDKYFGKQFSEEEFSQVLRSFLDNGVCFRSDLIPTVIKMLSDLRASISTLPSFRYFSSSLLLIYDGAECPHGLQRRGGAGERRQRTRGTGRKRRRSCEEESEKTDVCKTKDSHTLTGSGTKHDMISNSNNTPMATMTSTSIGMENTTSSTCTNLSAAPTSSYTEEATPTSSSLLDATSTCGALLEATPTSNITHEDTVTSSVLVLNTPTCNSHRVIPDIRLETSSHITYDGTSPLPRTQNKVYANHTQDTSLTSEMTTPSLMSTSELTEDRHHIDLRMIDFARSTHADHYDQTCYEGLDECYLDGLDSLIQLFQQMSDDSSEEESDFEAETSS